MKWFIIIFTFPDVSPSDFTSKWRDLYLNAPRMKSGSCAFSRGGGNEVKCTSGKREKGAEESGSLGALAFTTAPSAVQVEAFTL